MSILEAGASRVGTCAVGTPPTLGLFLAVQKKLTSRIPSGFYSICGIRRGGAKEQV